MRLLLPLLVTLAAIAVAYLSGVPTLTLVAATALSAIGAIWQYVANNSFVYKFSLGSWKTDGAGFAISIPEHKHHHGKNVTVEVSEKSGNLYQKVICDDQIDGDGNVTVLASQPFIGKVVLN